jgi:ribosomal protein S13
MDLFFSPKAKKVPYSSTIYIELFSIYGFSFYKYFLLMKGCGFYFVNKRNFGIINLNKLYWINFFFLNNFIFSTDLRLYKRGKKLKYMAYTNYKRARVLNKLPVRGQRTQTNSRTSRHLNN